MKQNKPRGILNHPGSMRLIYFGTIIEMIIIVGFMQCGIMKYYFGKWCHSGDTSGYYKAWDSIMTDGVDALRTPVYPAFLHGIKTVFGPWSDEAALLCQCLIFLIAIHYFRKLASMLIRNETVVYWTTAIFAWFPGIVNFNLLILTESLSLSCSVFMCFWLAKTCCDLRTSHIVKSAVFLFILIFLRPAFIFLIPISILFWIILTCRRRGPARPITVGFSSVAIIIICLGAYVWQMNRVYGIKSTSIVSDLNSYAILCKHGLISTSAKGITDSAIRETVESDTNTPDLWKLWIEFGNERTSAAIRQAVSYDRPAYLLALTSQAKESCSLGLTAAPAINLGGGRWFTFHYPTMGMLYVMLGIYAVFLLCSNLRQRRFSLIQWTLLAILVSNIIVAIAGAQDSWNRLIEPSIFIAILMGGQLWESAASALARQKRA